MPRVKTISPGRLTGISGLTTEASRGVKFNKDTEYAYKLEEWKTQNDRIAEVEKEVLITLSKKALKCYRYATLP